MNFSSVLVVTYGRSGSTLLQGLLNSIDGYLVRGENHNFCYGLFQAYGALRRTQSEFGTTVESFATDPWFGANRLNADMFLRDCAGAVRRQLLGHTAPEAVMCLGFKEIRYTGMPDLEEYLSFLEKILPHTAFVFLTRDHASVARSGWWRNMSVGDVHAELEAFEARAKRFAERRNNCCWIDYESMIKQGKPLEDMFRFLGARYDADAVRRVLSVTHSYVEGGKAKELQLTYVAFDPLPPALSLTVLSIGGVAVINGEAVDAAALIATCGAKACEVRWGLPSPLTGELYSGNARAANARFAVDVSACTPGTELVLEVVMPDNSRVEIARCRVPPSTPA